ncbi:MAG TPA: TIGR03067 domain-containing protein [Gemmataceae bacterium]|nr:TIGR03067 domain-containing protein [Gemmataceae bacterium]
MRRFSLLVVAVLCAGLAFAEESKKDLDKLQGVWARSSIVRNGKQVPADDFKNAKLTLKGDKYTLDEGKETRTGTFKLDGSKNPKTLDIISDAGPNKGKTLKGIYKIEDDTFTYCVAGPDKDRPTEFSSKEGSGHTLLVNKRAK